MIAKVKGTADIFKEDIAKWQRLEDIIRRVAKLYNFKEIRTPIFESSDLFHRGVGDSTDIVKKETYDFMDRGERMITLRPEGTAAVVRSVIENKLYTDPVLPLKYYYVGPMFRYERPQKGRLRQFHQFGAEALGSYSPLVDAEIISYAVTFLKALRIPSVTVKINSLGDQESKDKYRKVLMNYLEPVKKELCSDCQNRLLTNPLRVLDCKADHNNPVLLEAPKPLDYLNDVSKEHFDQVIHALQAMELTYVIDSSLVRGLDYYTHTVFELEADLPTLGSNAVICAGGRYNDLVKNLDGPDFPAVGFAFGMERLLLAAESAGFETDKEYLHAFIISLGEKATIVSQQVAKNLRLGGLMVDSDLMNRPFKGQFKQAERLQAMFYLILGDTEIDQGVINVKNARTGDQITVELSQLYPRLIDLIKQEIHACSGNCESCQEEC